MKTIFVDVEKLLHRIFIVYQHSSTMKHVLASLVAILSIASCSSITELGRCLEDKLPKAFTDGCRKEETAESKYVLMTLHLYGADPEIRYSVIGGNYFPTIAFLREKEPSSDINLLTSLGIAYLQEAETKEIFHLSPTPQECREIHFDYERASHYFHRVWNLTFQQEEWIEELLHQTELKTQKYSTCPEIKLRQPPIDPAILK